ncbi:glycosyl hydrolase family 25 [Bifidobacterium margollesii]|uniref:Glycosyl hydrolase family 25 n=1 Tax=Bifidobacterium margollesii TaxID=2020964 RepID=A0A2N5JAU1_9BIFI|nr:hypothetical protein [Bifidobacterium margollesii]PLS31315.1 glycosyl hydrolase family 25 [Bifidobacterium margollesii]
MPVTASAANGDVAVSAANFPIATFRQYVSSNLDRSPHNGVLSVAERNSAIEIDLFSKNVTSLKGVEYFPRLDKLYAPGNRLTSINVSHNTQLTVLDVKNNLLTSLDITRNPRLDLVWVNGNRLSSLNVSRNTALSYLDVSGNRLTGLDVTHNRRLQSLTAGSNRLTSLNLANNPVLFNLAVSGNQLSSLDLSHNPNMTFLNSSGNRLLAARVPSDMLFETASQKQNAYVVDGTSLNVRRLIPWFTLSKVSGVRGGTISPSGVITPSSRKPGSVVSYSYGTGGSGNWIIDMEGIVDVKVSFTMKGASTKPGTSGSVRQVPVYRVYNRRSGLHHYTANKAEKDMLVRLGWRDESRKGASFITVAKGTAGAKPVYREYNRRTGNHNWTLNKREHDMLVRLGWKNEGVAWYAPSSGKNVYRLYNRNSGEHVYTMSYGEYVAVQRAGWRGEGIAWKSL